MRKLGILLLSILLCTCRQKENNPIKITETLYHSNHKIQKQTIEGVSFEGQNIPYKNILYFDTLERLIRGNYIIGKEKMVDTYQRGDSSIIWTRYILDSASSLSDTIFPISDSKIFFLKEQRWRKGSSLLIYEYSEIRDSGKVKCVESRYDAKSGTYVELSNCR